MPESKDEEVYVKKSEVLKVFDETIQHLQIPMTIGCDFAIIRLALEGME